MFIVDLNRDLNRFKSFDLNHIHPHLCSLFKVNILLNIIPHHCRNSLLQYHIILACLYLQNQELLAKQRTVR